MSNLISYLKDKIYYVLGATVLIIVILIIISSCSNGSSSYESIENKMVSAAKEYYTNNKSRLPKIDGGSVKITIGTLVDEELLKEIKDPNNKEQTCSGYVEVTKVGKEYSYSPFLVCKGNYEPKYLADIIKSSKLDEYGNGVYTINNELVYRGSDVKNYVSFNNQLWRIVKVDTEGDIKLVLADCTDEAYAFDSEYNRDVDQNYGITTDYLHTDIRKTLVNYYKKNFNKNSKAKIISKDLCVSGYVISDEFSAAKECSIIKEKEKIGLLNVSDYQNASLDSNCTTLEKQECGNQNYLSDSKFSTWTLNISTENSYEAIALNSGLHSYYAINEINLNPVVYITKKSIILTGNGAEIKPYIIK